MKPSASTPIESVAHFVAACRRLIDEQDVRHWWPARSRFEVMVGAILVQNTRWINVEKAIAALKNQHTLEPRTIATLAPADLQHAVRSSGCQSIKARRLRAMAGWLVKAGGIDALQPLPTETLRARMLGVEGIGDETADAILCFALSRPVFIADRYARDWLTRLGCWQGRGAGDYRACRTWAERRLSGSGLSMQSLHAAIVLHGQRTCRRQPDCDICRQRPWCLTGLQRFPVN